MSAALRPLAGPAPDPPGTYDLAALGYSEQEFRFDGTAQSYELMGDRTADGEWSVRPSETASFTTRLLLRQPSDPARFSGTVVVEWLNVSAGIDAAPDWMLTHTDLMRRGHAWAGVSAQRAGIDGGGMVEGLHLKKLHPDRYSFLAHPGDAWSFDIFSQAGHALRSHPAVLPDPVSARPLRLLASGHSQSASFLVTYVNAIDPLAAVFDGFLVHGRLGAGAALDTGFHPGAGRDGSGERIRSEPRVPVLVLQVETDVALLGSGRARQDDGELLRLWELAGAAHADTYLLSASWQDDGNLLPQRLAGLIRPTTDLVLGHTDKPANSGPQHHYVECAAVEHLDAWVAGHSAPPSAPRLELTSDGLDLFAMSSASRWAASARHGQTFQLLSCQERARRASCSRFSSAPLANSTAPSWRGSTRAARPTISAGSKPRWTPPSARDSCWPRTARRFWRWPPPPGRESPPETHSCARMVRLGADHRFTAPLSEAAARFRHGSR